MGAPTHLDREVGAPHQCPGVKQKKTKWLSRHWLLQSFAFLVRKKVVKLNQIRFLGKDCNIVTLPHHLNWVRRVTAARAFYIHKR